MSSDKPTLTPPEVSEMMICMRRRMQLRQFDKTPDWCDALQKEATRDLQDLPITDTKVVAVLQGRRVQRGAWWVTLQSPEEWRKHFSPRLKELIDQTDALLRMRDMCKSMLNNDIEITHFMSEEAIKALEILAGGDADELINACNAEVAMIKRGTNLI